MSGEACVCTGVWREVTPQLPTPIVWPGLTRVLENSETRKGRGRGMDDGRWSDEDVGAMSGSGSREDLSAWGLGGCPAGPPPPPAVLSC